MSLFAVPSEHRMMFFGMVITALAASRLLGSDAGGPRGARCRGVPSLATPRTWSNASALLSQVSAATDGRREALREPRLWHARSADDAMFAQEESVAVAEG